MRYGKDGLIRPAVPAERSGQLDPRMRMAQLPDGDLRMGLEMLLQLSPGCQGMLLNPVDWKVLLASSAARRPWVLNGQSGVVECLAHGGVPKGRVMLIELEEKR